MLSRLSDAISEKFDEMNRTVEVKRSGNDAEALELFRSNRGKLLMDEINVFLSSIIRNADLRLTTGVIQQKANAENLRLASGLGGIVILLVVGAVTILGARYAKEIAEARDEVQHLNVSLERRVKERTSALTRALERAEMLLAEVNHRVGNSLSLVASLVRLQARSVQEKSAKDALGETEARIYAIADVHRQLYTSGDAGFVALNEYLADLLKRLEKTMHSEGHGAVLHFELAPIKSTPDASVNLGVVMNEWVTNAFKYAYPDSRGEVRVRLQQLEPNQGELVVEDDGVGMVPGLPAKGTGLGSKLVTAMAANLNGEVKYLANGRGTSARLTFPLSA
jgi:two-component sensor histidine kinase